MSIEPLRNLLQIYSDKHKVLLYYLPKETIQKLNNYEYVHDHSTLFLNDRLLFVKKSTGKFYKQGNIIKINDYKITIKTNSGNISLNKNEYYIFIHPRKNKLKKTNRKFYEELLKNLG